MYDIIAVKMYARIVRQRDSYKQRIADIKYCLSDASVAKLSTNSIIEAETRSQVLTAVVKDLTKLLDAIEGVKP